MRIEDVQNSKAVTSILCRLTASASPTESCLREKRKNGWRTLSELNRKEGGSQEWKRSNGRNREPRVRGRWWQSPSNINTIKCISEREYWSTSSRFGKGACFLQDVETRQ